MPETLLILAILLPAIAGALRSRGRRGLILHRPYNNRHNDATAARDHRY
jgi:hypothetical protein